MKDNICNGCDGSGKHPDFLKEYGDECSSCKGTGISSRMKDEVTCPYCGVSETDSWEAADSDNKRQCGSCEKFFQYDSEVTRTFTSWRVECLNDESKHLWKENDWYKDKRRDGKMYAYCKSCQRNEWIPIVTLELNPTPAKES